MRCGRLPAAGIRQARKPTGGDGMAQEKSHICRQINGWQGWNRKAMATAYQAE
jgi:hypothetical protein